MKNVLLAMMLALLGMGVAYSGEPVVISEKHGTVYYPDFFTADVMGDSGSSTLLLDRINKRCPVDTSRNQHNNPEFFASDVTGDSGNSVLLLDRINKKYPRK